MAFILHHGCSPTAKLLANKLWDFVTYKVGFRPNVYDIPQLLDEWAVTFDEFLQKYEAAYVLGVFDFYVKNWTAQDFIYQTPEAFIRGFPIVSDRYQQQKRPIAEIDLRPVLRRLIVEQWPCSWEDVVTAVSQSVYHIRWYHRLLVEIPNARDLTTAQKRQLRVLFGNPCEYVTNHFLSYRNSHHNGIRGAVITPEYILAELQRYMGVLGYPPQRIRKFAKLFSEKFAKCC